MPPTAEFDPPDRLRIRDLARHDALAASFAEDVRRGLTSEPKRLFPKYFYDELGSVLFEAICLLPEYYLTRAENEILTRYADEMVNAVGGRAAWLLELGSGSATKTRLVIEALFRRQDELLYTPVDISVSALESSARILLQSYPALRIAAYASDYDAALAALRRSEPRTGRALVLFLGSNVGNFDRDDALAFLRSVRDVLRVGDALLLGADLKKEPSKLEAAYDDALGITAAFNLNLLSRINREFDADFDTRAFRHVAVYNEAAGRVELYLESRRVQQVVVRKLGLSLRFDEGERIHTENSHKYSLDQLSEMASLTGFMRARTWLDQREQFSSNLFFAVE